MAIGDVNVAISAANTELTFQPSGTNVFFVNLVWAKDAQLPNLTDGALITQQGYGVTNGFPRGFFITNSFYLRIPAQGGADISGYSMIQTA